MPTSVRGPQTATAPRGAVDSFFQITQRGSTVGREVRGGLVTFFTMAYIIVLNPIIIGTQADATGTFLGGGKTPNLAMVAACTALVAGVMTMLMGVVANYPLALATGLGLNAFVAFAIAKLPGMTWPDAMGLIVIEGIIILVLVLTGFRQAVFRAVPTQLKTAISVGIGLFIAVIGLVDAGFVRAPGRRRDPGGARHRRLPQRLAAGGVRRRAAGHDRRCCVKGSGARSSIGIVGGTILAMVVEAHRQHRQRHRRRQDGQPHRMAVSTSRSCPSKLLDIPDFGLLGHFSLLGSFSKIGIVSACLLIFTLMLADFFDTMGTMAAIGAEAGLLDEEGNPPNAQRILVVDSVAAAAGGAASVAATRRTSSPRPGSARAHGPVWPPWSPACCSCSRRSSRRWCRSSRTRRRPRRWSSSAS